MHEPSGHEACSKARGRRRNVAEQACRAVFVHGLAVVVLQGISDETFKFICLPQCRQPLETANTDMAVVKPYQYCRAGWRRFVASHKGLTSFDDREGARSRDPERFEHFGGEHLAHAALQCQTAIAEAAIGCGARALCAQVHQAVPLIATLREQEPSPVADIGVVNAELVTVIAERQRLRE